MTSPVDFDLHGFAGIRLLDASPEDVAVVTRQVGPIQASLTREPEIIVRFVDRLPAPSRVRYLGFEDAGFTDDAFLVLRSIHKMHARVQIPFDQIGRRCEMICERCLPAVPLLIPILNLTALGNGALPLHASAFNYCSYGVLATGWAKGGKTETLLAFMADKAEYVGDEWIYITRQDRQMYGIPEPIRLWEWHLTDLPQYRATIGRSDRAKLRVLKILLRSMDWAVKGTGRSTLTTRLVNRIKPVIKKQQFVQVPPERLFGVQSCTLRGSLDKVFFIASHEAPDIIIEPADPQEIAQRMVFSLQNEYLDLISYYLKFRFAFPMLRNELIERAEDLQLDALKRVLAGKEAYAVYHPYPVHIPSLFQAIHPYLKNG